MKLLHAILCRFRQHRALQVIQTFGAAQHIGCPRCGAELAIHHGEQLVLPWDADFAKLYGDMGYDIEGGRRQWQARRRVEGWIA